MPLSEQDEFLANERKTIEPRTAADIECLGTAYKNVQTLCLKCLKSGSTRTTSCQP